MKKYYFAVLIILAFILQGCEDDIRILGDGRSTMSYKIENRTDETVTAIVVYGHIANGDNIDELSKTVIIAPGAIKEIHCISEISAPGAIMTKDGGPKVRMALRTSTGVFAYGKKLNDNLFNIENWGFSAPEYNYATYLLVLTDELIEGIGYAEE